MKRDIIQILLLTGIMITVISCKSASTDQEAEEPAYGSELNTVTQDTIPSVLTVSSDIKRVVVVRLKNKTDLLYGLNEAVEKEGIKNGVILHGIGSVISYHIHAVSETTDFPTVNVFMEEEGPYDVLNINGFIFDGRVHAHITLSDLNTTIGGHLEPGTLAYTFLIISIGVLDDNHDMSQFDNWRWR
jgi:predicted DNA-binding protein with PD1-like motif